MVHIPAGLLQAVSFEGGGRLALVIGAGCSVEPPTDIPLAQALSTEANRKLVLDGVLVDGECADPGNLAVLASLIFRKTGTQHDLVSCFPLAKLKTAKPNLGHRLLVALMAEHAISYVLSLNFDLAVQNASSELGASIEIVDRSGQNIPASPTIIHLHGNANGPSDSLVLRRETIDAGWKGSWENVVANQILAAPNVLFIGLGSAAPVLSETITMITEAVGGGRTYFQADVVPFDDSYFAIQLDVPLDRYIEGGWCAVMEKLAERIAEEQIHTLKVTGTRVLHENDNPEDEIAGFLELAGRQQGLSLLALGQLRTFARLDTKTMYLPRTRQEEEVVAEPMAKLAAICRQIGLSAHPKPSGVWSLERDGRLIATALLASGGGVRRLAALESNLRHICRSISEVSLSGPDIVLIGGTMAEPAVVAAHVDIVADEKKDDIISGPTKPLILITNAADLVAQAEQFLNAA